MMKNIILIFVVLVTSFICITAKAVETTSTLTLTMDDLNSIGADKLELRFAIGGARVNINQSDSDEAIVNAVVTFDSEDPEPTLKIKSLGDKLFATFATGIPDLDDFDSLNTIQIWDITIGRYDVDTDLTFDAGGITGDIDFGGMPLEDCVLNLGGVDLSVDFSSPLTRRLEDFVINGGGTRLFRF